MTRRVPVALIAVALSAGMAAPAGAVLPRLPAFFVDVPAGIKILVAAGVVITVVFTMLIFSPGKRS